MYFCMFLKDPKHVQSISQWKAYFKWKPQLIWFVNDNKMRTLTSEKEDLNRSDLCGLNFALFIKLSPIIYKMSADKKFWNMFQWRSPDILLNIEVSKIDLYLSVEHYPETEC
jgi:hypothetical protein